MKRAVWAAIVAASVGVTVPALAQDTPPDAGAEAAPAADAPPAEAPPPPPAMTAGDASRGQANADGSAVPPPAGGLHADLLGAGIPLRFSLNGYFRTRFDYINHLPLQRGPTDSYNPSGDAAFAYMRLRLEPNITYGSDPATPIVALHSQIDILNNVVFGDDARLAPTPLFVENPSATGINGTDNNYVYVRRLWLEFLTPVGQIRVGRMASHGGMGLLFNDGNGFRNDWGDANGGSTFDRILFATRPLTIFNALTRGDARPTPLVLAVGHDWLVQDPLGVGQDPSCVTGTGATGGGIPCLAARSAFPLGFLANGQQAVQEELLVLAWNDPKINPNRLTDELSLGTIGVYRSQGVTNSNVWIYDAFWRARYSFFGNRGVQLFTNGEIYTIQGQTEGVALKGLTLDSNGRTVNGHGLETPIHANIWGGAIQAGVAMDDRWQAVLEGGYATGDEHLFDSSLRGGDPTRTLSQRAFSPDYHVGLLLFPVAVQAATANQYSGPLSVLQSGGGVWNASYLYPQVKLRIMSGVDILGAFLLAWADKLNTVYSQAGALPGAPADGSCGPFALGTSSCFLGWELDLGLKVSWGDHELMRWSNEFGIMQAGSAIVSELHGMDPDGTYHARFLWTFQSRFAMVF